MSVAVARRLLRRTDSIATLATIRHFPRVEDRVLLALWHLGSTWGRVNHRGMIVPFRLTHAVLGEIAGAQRPTVTLAIGTLRRQGHLIRDEDGCYVITPTAEPLLLRRRRVALSA
jgi:CRP-like cAMP-binding protein